jgi:hypothetical protein
MSDKEMFDKLLGGKSKEVHDKAETVAKEITEFLKNKYPDLDRVEKAHALSIGCVLAAAEQIASFVTDPSAVLIGSNIAAKILVATSLLKHSEKIKREIAEAEGKS